MNPINNEETDLKMVETPMHSTYSRYYSVSLISESNLLDDENSGKSTYEDLPKSSAENIISLAKLKNG